MNKLVFLAVVSAVVVTSPEAVRAEPTPLAPSAASLADSRPLLSWAPAPGDEPNILTIASSPDITPEGKFFDENRVDIGFPSETATSWQPTTRLHAGAYWWNLSWSNTAGETYVSAITAPAAFAIPVNVRVTGVSIRQWTYSLDTATVAYVSNARYPVVTCSVYHGAKLITRKSKRDDNYASGVKRAGSCEVNVAKSYAGKRLKLVGSVKAGSKTSAALRYFYGARG